MNLSPNTASKLLSSAFIASLMTITWLEWKQKSEIPAPARFVGAGLSYGILGLLSPLSPGLFGMFGIGLYFALLWKYYNQPDSGTERPLAGNGGSAKDNVTI